MPTIFFITHPDVAIDPGVPVPDWPLNERGRARMHAMTTRSWARGVRRIFASSERKAHGAAQIFADALGLGENDRSATGFLAKDQFTERYTRLCGPQAEGWESGSASTPSLIR